MLRKLIIVRCYAPYRRGASAASGHAATFHADACGNSQTEPRSWVDRYRRLWTHLCDPPPGLTPPSSSEHHDRNENCGSPAGCSRSPGPSAIARSRAPRPSSAGWRGSPGHQRPRGTEESRGPGASPEARLGRSARREDRAAPEPPSRFGDPALSSGSRPNRRRFSSFPRPLIG